MQRDARRVQAAKHPALGVTRGSSHCPLITLGMTTREGLLPPPHQTTRWHRDTAMARPPQVPSRNKGLGLPAPGG